MFGGFRASLNLFGKKNKKDLHSELTPDMCVSGAYRSNRDDFFGNNNSYDQRKKSAPTQMLQQIRPAKSTNYLIMNKNIAPKARKSFPEVSRDPRGAEQVEQRNGSQKQIHDQEKEQRKLEKLEKQRIADQKAREKRIAQEQAKQEKLRREREMREAQQNKQKRDKRPEKKRQAPKPQLSQPQASTSAQQVTRYSTDTLESSISRSSGPPPYSEVPTQSGLILDSSQNLRDQSGNVIYNKPVDTGSWDMISQHREEINRPTTNIPSGKSKQMVMDLNYNFGARASHPEDNSEA